MRIIHTADIHIGIENYGRVDPATGLSSRLTDFLAAFDQVVDYALENGADLVLCCGDAYKSRDPSQTHQREFAKRVARLATAGIPVFIVVGNHDMPHVFGRATALEIFSTLDVANVHVGDSPGTYLVRTAAGPLQIVAVPWIRRGAFLAREETRGLTPDQVNEAMEERLARIVGTQAASLDTAVPAVLAGHLTVSGATTSSEQSMMLGRDPVLTKSSVALPQFDYVALGHIHKHQILGRDPHVVYSGSLERIDFGEEGDEKGFCVIDLDPAQPAGSRLQAFSFERVDARAFLTISVKVRLDDTDTTDTVLKEVSRHYIDGSIVRLQIQVPAELEGHLRDGEIRGALENAHFVASISKEVLDRPRTRLGPGYSRGLDPREALDVYLATRDISEDRAELLRRQAERLMGEQAPD